MPARCAVERVLFGCQVYLVLPGTDVLPSQEALRVTREAVGQAEANSWLPFTAPARTGRVAP